MQLCFSLVIPFFFILTALPSYECSREEEEALEFLKWYNSTEEGVVQELAARRWKYETNLTKENKEEMTSMDVKYSEFRKTQARNASRFKAEDVKDAYYRRQLEKVQYLGLNLPEEAMKNMSSLRAKMMERISRGWVCGWREGRRDCGDKWTLMPQLTHIMATSRDYDLLTYVWKEWRNVSASIKTDYRRYIKYGNDGAKSDGLEDMGDYWRKRYETHNFTQQVEKLYFDILPLYEQLHAYVRRRLALLYPHRFSPPSIPAHILGNMWGLQWGQLFDIMTPFPNVSNASNIDVSGEMKRQNYTQRKMVEVADDFFQSLGLLPLRPDFYTQSILSKPPNRSIVCHPSAWDMHNRKDVRLKMCAEVEMVDLITIHHELGHIQNFMQYQHQPMPFRVSPNDAIHEAIGDIIALSFSTPTHLMKIGLLDHYKSSYETEINYLFRQALNKVAFLPYGYILDLWRWRVFSGNISFDYWNHGWWELRHQYQGLVPPVSRPQEAFDAGAKTHVGSNTPYIRYFISFFVQFQFYKAMCAAAEHKGPLYECDFYGNKKAGDKLAKMMRLGSSKPWPEAMKVMTGQSEMSAQAIKEYFAPLNEWLKKDNEKTGNCYGWGYEWPPHIMKTLPHPRCASASPSSTLYPQLQFVIALLFIFYLQNTLSC